MFKEDVHAISSPKKEGFKKRIVLTSEPKINLESGDNNNFKTTLNRHADSAEHKV